MSLESSSSSFIPEGHGSPKGACDNAVWVPLVCCTFCCCGAIAGLVCQLYYDPMLAAALAVVTITVFVIFVIVMLLSLRAWWVKPPYEEFMKAGNVMLTAEQEKALTERDEPLDSFTYIGTHNSCHVCAAFGGLCIKPFQYTHASLGKQLELGIRHLELDIWYNRGAKRWEIWHESIDPLAASHFLFADALRYIHEWSLQNRDHFPLNFNIDIKGAYQPGTGFLVPFLTGRGLGPVEKQDEILCCRKCLAVQVDAREAFAALDAEIRAVWRQPAAIFAPADIKDEEDTSMGLAVARKGWPSVKKLKGSALFMLNIYGQKGDLQEEAEGFCFWPRANFKNKDYIYSEDGYPEECIARHAFERAFVGHGEMDQFRSYVGRGVHLISADSPASFGYHSVFLREEQMGEKDEAASAVVEVVVEADDVSSTTKRV